MTSRPAPKRRAEKPKKGLSRSSGSSSSAGSANTGRRVAGRTVPPAGEATRSPQVSATPMAPPSPAETTLIRTEITEAQTEITSHMEVSPPLTALPAAEAAPFRSSPVPSSPASPSYSPSSSAADERPSGGRRAARTSPEPTASAPRESAPRTSSPSTPPPSPSRGKRVAELPPIPADATAQIDAVSEHTTITERRSGELRSARRATPPGSRSARTRTGKSRRLPTPAVIGAAALVVAGIGAVAVSSAKPPVMETADFQALSADVSGSSAKRYDPNNVDVTRDFDRALLDKQAEQQAAQLSASLAALADRTEARSQEIKKKQWVLPLTGYRLTAHFGQSSSLWSTVHTGLDFAAPSGTPLVAIARGTVKSTGYDGSYGNKTVLTLEDGTEIWYCHQSSVKVSPGTKVDPGTVIGYVGSTGNSTGPHLHLEVRPGGGSPVDPLAALRAHNVNP